MILNYSLFQLDGCMMQQNKDFIKLLKKLKLVTSKYDKNSFCLVLRRRYTCHNQAL